MTVTENLIAQRPVPGRVPPFPKSGVSPFLHSLIPSQLPNWLKERILGASTQLDPKRYEDMIQGLWEGDPAMDKVVEWMFATGAKQGKQLFDQALEHGIDSIPDTPAELREFFAIIDQRPDWVNMSRVRKGARAMNTTGEVFHYLVRDLALMGGYLLSGLNEPLVMTGALNKGTGRRFAETQSWAMDIYSPNGMERFGAGFKSTIHVRMIHALVRRNLQRKPEWDLERFGLPISQTDMLATILVSVILGLASRALGVPMTSSESEDIVHHGRYVAWLIGVKDDFLFDSAAEGLSLLLHSASTQPRGDETSRIMAQSLAAEPLTRHYERFQYLRRRIEHSKHLGISRLFLSKRTLDKLGVPSNVLPWYPLLTIAPRLASQTLHRLVPGGYRRLSEQGYKEQMRMLQVFQAGAKSAAGIIKPDAQHPAHV